MNHSVSEFAQGTAYPTGIESFWTMLRHGYQGTCRKMTGKQLGSYLNEFSCRENVRGLHIGRPLTNLSAILRPQKVL